MEKEICEFYTPINRKSNKLCKYFNGNVDKKCQLERCRYHCDILESKAMMEEGQVFRRVKGALRKK